MPPKKYMVMAFVLDLDSPEQAKKIQAELAAILLNGKSFESATVSVLDQPEDFSAEKPEDSLK